MDILPSGATPERQIQNVEATNTLLGVVGQEALHPQTVIGSEVWFQEDGEFDSTVGPQMAEIRDPSDNDNAYLVGMRPDGTGQVIMLQLEQGGVVGRVVLTLRQNQPTSAFGERRESYGTHGKTRRNILQGEPVDPALLLQLSTVLPEAFEAKRQSISRQKRLRTAIGRVGFAMGGRLARLQGRSHKDGDMHLQELRGDPDEYGR